jgi:curved DNA-binding protein CbpA
MTGAQLNRLYRKKAMQLHPDRGGDHDLFIELTAVYESLRQMKK